MSAKTAERMVEWIEDNTENDSALPRKVSLIAYSEYSVSAKRHEYTGVPFREYISERRRINTADERSTADNRMIDIALDCGFSLTEALLRAFGTLEVYEKEDKKG